MSEDKSIIQKIIKGLTNGITKGGVNLSAGVTKTTNEFFKHYNNANIVLDYQEIKQIINKINIEKREELLLKQTTTISNQRFTNKRNHKSYQQDEVLWERLILLTNNGMEKKSSTTLYNQLCVSDNNKESIDIVQVENNKITKLIELKTNKNTNNPLFAFVESLKNYYLIDKIDKINIKNVNKDISELILLAPKFYYEHFFCSTNYEKYTKSDNFVKRFMTFIKNYNKSSNPKFKLFYFDISAEDMQNFVDELSKLQSKNGKKNEAEIINLLQNNPNILNNLRKWKEIKSADEWLNLNNSSKSDLSL